MMSYDDFMKLSEELKIDPKEYLPESFEEIFDEFDYNAEDVKKFSKKSLVTVRRWCHSGELKIQSKRPYICKGIDIKRKLFKDIYQQNIAPRLKDLIV
ncbi:hypothetical protein [Falsibacillus pallidus]|uniref:Helix-turn-helix protein n=1 Tax=Falsibacillus pallidus TaxID=493781 RepID=A0A370GQ17_9BACI|nr:hypothetical protein [Falsibacillus pallidus]RDI44063.1 hypothetical protein DFR59_103126 [Falsibacillus pallidus]